MVALFFALPFGCATYEPMPPREDNGSGGSNQTGGNSAAGSAGHLGNSGTSNTGGSVGSPSTGGGGAGGNPGAGIGGSPDSSFGQDAGNAPLLITDLENGPSLGSGRVGAWYTYNDMSSAGMQSPDAGADFVPTKLVPPREASNYAAHTQGSGFALWGAGMGFDLNNNGAGKLVYDASHYSGITFWAKGTSTKPVRVNFPSKDTSPEGGVCNSAMNKCSDHFGAKLNLTADWTKQDIKFTETAQQMWGIPQEPSLDAAQLYGVQFQVEPGVTFDIWIDDVSFLP
jgi:hypothetical protein